MTTIQIEFWDLVRMAGAVVAVLIGAFWVLIVMMIGQFKADLKRRFEALEKAREEASQEASKRLDDLERLQRSTDKDILMLRAELPDKYVRREDAIRSEMGLHAKLDGLAVRMDLFFGKNTNV